MKIVFYILILLIVGVISLKMFPYYGQCNSINHNNESSSTYSRVEIFYYGWDILVRSKLSLDNVRDNAKIKIIISDSYEIENFIKWARLNELQEIIDSKNEIMDDDPRLVIDMFDSENKRITYYASRFRILTEDSTKWRKIDDEFKKKFHF